ncbi:bifunctional folylpolyglutamate synthase/dihydrofolate synthase [Lysobacter fragariae]
MQRTLADWLEYIERQHPKSIELGLDRVREVATRMGLKKPAKNVITVAGTNGKGSTVAFIEAIARSAGWKVGAYTSPHLLAYNERVRVDGDDAGDADLVAAFEAIEAARLQPAAMAKATGKRVASMRRPQTDAGIAGPDVALPETTKALTEAAPTEVPLTYFEFGTLAALWLFARSGLDLAILEVGLGGRLDATNIVDPDVAVITTVDLDHQDWLGTDRETIGLEKAGIARAFKPLVLGDDDPPASVLRHAYAIGASAVRAGCDFLIEPEHRTLFEAPVEGWRWREVGFAIDLPMPALAAPVQVRNAATAIAALRALGKTLPRAAIVQGVSQARVAGRLQRFERDGVDVVVDVGHNPQAARELAAWLAAAPPTGRTHAVFAALGDKDAAGVVDALADRIDTWQLGGLTGSGPRGLDVDAFAARLAGTVAGEGARHADVAGGLAAVLAGARPGDRVLVFGSFHTAAAALEWLAKHPLG